MQKIFKFLNFIDEKVSDVYIYANRPIFYKKNGIICQTHSVELAVIEDFIKEVLSNKAYNFLRNGIEQDISLTFENFFCRVHIFLSQNTPALFFRILPQKIYPLFDFECFLPLKKNLESKKGLLLIVGATGSGKTTMANAILDYFNTYFCKHIVSIEEPIEFKHQQKNSFFTLREVGHDTQSFETGIISAMRQTPDIIFIGELRDFRAIQATLLASQTGHLVLATLHSNDSVGGLLRFLNAFEDKKRASYEIAESLIGMIALRKEDKKEIEFEILLANAAIKNLIKEEKFHQIPSQIALSKNEGMINF